MSRVSAFCPFLSMSTLLFQTEEREKRGWGIFLCSGRRRRRVTGSDLILIQNILPSDGLLLERDETLQIHAVTQPSIIYRRSPFISSSVLCSSSERPSGAAQKRLPLRPYFLSLVPLRSLVSLF